MESTLPQAQNPSKIQNFPFEYKGSGGELFGLYLKTILFSILTLGIYSFWGKVEINKFLFSNTNFNNRTFGYHATGRERFIGFLKGMGIVIAIFLFAGLLSKILPILGSLLLAIIILAGQPLIIIGKFRFLLSRSSWSQVRFRFTGQYKEFMVIYLRELLFTILTLGIYTPWFVNNIQSYLYNHSFLGDKAFSYHGKGGEMFKIYLKGVIFTILTLGIYLFWFQAELLRYIFRNTQIDGNPFECTMTGGRMLKMVLVSYIIVVFTLALGMGLAVNYVTREFFSTLSIKATPESLSVIQAVADKRGSALADGVAEAAEAVDAVADFI